MIRVNNNDDTRSSNLVIIIIIMAAITLPLHISLFFPGFYSNVQLLPELAFPV